MATTVFVDYSTPIVAAWLNHVNRLAYHVVDFDESAAPAGYIQIGGGTFSGGVFLDDNAVTLCSNNFAQNLFRITGPYGHTAFGPLTTIYEPATTRRAIHFARTANLVATSTPGTGAITEVMHQVVDIAGAYQFTEAQSTVVGHRIRMTQDGIAFDTAPAGVNVAWGSGLFIDAVHADVGMGYTAPLKSWTGKVLHINAANGEGSGIHFTHNGGVGAVRGFAVFKDTSHVANIWQYENLAMQFGVNNALAATISAAGYLGVGVVPTSVLTLKNPTAAVTQMTILPNGSSGQIIFRNAANSQDNLQIISTETYGLIGTNPGLELRLTTNNTAQVTIHATTGVITTLPTYNNTSGSAANVYVDSSGILYRSTSSLKYKTDVVGYNKGMTEVLSLRPVSYKEKDKETSRVFTGLIAEEVHAAGLGEFVEYAADGTPDALLYSNMVALLVNAVKELHARVAILEGR